MPNDLLTLFVVEADPVVGIDVEQRNATGTQAGDPARLVQALTRPG